MKSCGGITDMIGHFANKKKLRGNGGGATPHLRENQRKFSP